LVQEPDVALGLAAPVHLDDGFAPDQVHARRMWASWSSLTFPAALHPI
jgi:hypothetical protein